LAEASWPEGAAVYSQDNPSCPPRFAYRLCVARPCVKLGAKRVRHSPTGGTGQSNKPLK
jgi:hypothetical protein